MARSNEPLVWAPFSAGMMIDALVIPALVVITGLLVPLGWAEEDVLFEMFAHPIARLAVFVVVSLSLFHAAHRLRFALVDLGLKALKGPVGIVLLYGGALAGTALAGAVAFDAGAACGRVLAACCGG
jgi:fumarate reductase subunit D